MVSPTRLRGAGRNRVRRAAPGEKIISVQTLSREIAITNDHAVETRRGGSKVQQGVEFLQQGRTGTAAELLQIFGPGRVGLGAEIASE